MATLHDIYEQLIQPWPAAELQLLPKAVTQDGSKALALPYMNSRMVTDRLDKAAGPGNWSDHYEILAHHIGTKNERWWAVVRCQLTVLGVTVEGIGEAEWVPGSGGNNEVFKAAESDALKRAAVKVGIGRYLSTLPKRYLAYDNQKKRFTEPYKLGDAQITRTAPHAGGDSNGADGAGEQQASAGGNGKPKQVTDEQLSSAVAKWEKKHGKQATLQDKAAIRRWLATGQLPTNGDAPAQPAPQPAAQPAPQPVAAGGVSAEEEIF